MVRAMSEEYANDLQNLVNLFGVDVEVEHRQEDDGFGVSDEFSIKADNFEETFSQSYNLDEKDPLKRKSVKKHRAKRALYDKLSKRFGITLPWGCLTGVRPTKLARELVENGQVKEFLVPEVLEKDYCVSRDKAKLVSMILKNQKCIIRNDKLVDLYINIPVCPSRCLYCSFISSEIGAVKGLIDNYLECLVRELEAVKQVIKDKTYMVRTIYIGGGTPSVLSADQLDFLLSALNFPVDEFTVECGRPDTITEDKLAVLKKHRVTRISVNPQTFCEATLKRIGRPHKNAQVLKAYQMALEKGFVVNMDIIAGLPGEKFGIFKRTIATLLDLYPENITVHTLSVKNGALLKNSGTVLSEKDIAKMVDYAEKTLIERGYKPYYLYRQKNQLGGLENVGFFRDDHVCIFNIDSMEETASVIACGAGAMSKRVFNMENRIERQSNPKFLADYIARIDEIITKKKDFFA